MSNCMTPCLVSACLTALFTTRGRKRSRPMFPCVSSAAPLFWRCVGVDVCFWASLGRHAQPMNKMERIYTARRTRSCAGTADWVWELVADADRLCLWQTRVLQYS